MASKTIKIFRGTTGINNKIDPARIRFDSETGISALAACVNCDIDDTGRIFRRDGFAITNRTEFWNNLFGCGDYGLGTKGNALCVIDADLSYTPIRNITPNARMSYARDTNMVKEVVYYCNGYENGRIVDRVSSPWPVGNYIGPATRKSFSAAPLGHILERRNLRMFIAQDNILWYSEPSAYSLYRLSANYFVFPSRIRMVQAVTGGLWISDSESIYWLGGEITPSMLEMPIQIKVADYPAIEGTAVKAKGSRIGEGMPGLVIVFTTADGICVGTGDGQLVNITERKLDLPSGLAGAGLYRDGKYIVTIN